MYRGLSYCVEGGEQNHPKEKEKQEGEVVIWGSFMNSGRMKRSKKQGKEGKVHPLGINGI